MRKIWFRVGMEADVTDEEMEELMKYSHQIDGERDTNKAEEIMRNLIKRGELSGETYILGKDNGGADDYDNPPKEINFLL